MELWGQTSGTRRKRGRRQRGGAMREVAGGRTRRNRGRRQRGGLVWDGNGGTRRNRGCRQRGGEGGIRLL